MYHMLEVLKKKSLLVCAWCIVAAQWGVAQTTFPAPKQTEGLVAKVAEDLSLGDPGSVERAIQQIDFWVDTGDVRKESWEQWLPILMSQERYEEVARITLNGARNRPRLDCLVSVLTYRTKALLAMGKVQEAAGVAKQLYSVIELKNTKNAVLLLAQCISKLESKDEQVVMRELVKEQTTKSDPDAVGVQERKSAILAIKADAEPFRSLLSEFKTRTRRFKDQIAYGNLLILSERPSDARVHFEKLAQSAQNAEDYRMATEGAARAMRAEDGSVVRANAYLAEVQDSTTKEANKK